MDSARVFVAIRIILYLAYSFVFPERERRKSERRARLNFETMIEQTEGVAPEVSRLFGEAIDKIDLSAKTPA